MDELKPNDVRTIDLVICTYNRSDRISPLVENVLAVRVPDGWRRRVYLVNNNSRDDSAEVATRLAERHAPDLTYVFEGKQGLSNARNAGIAAGSGDLVGFVDDDELLHPDWFVEAVRAFEADPDLGYISGTCEPDYESPPPDWLPLRTYPAVLGVIRLTDHVTRYGPAFDEVMMGGNTVIRRAALDRVGGFNPNLGRSGNGTQTGEDREMQTRLHAAGFEGEYRPDLIIYHHVPTHRMQRGYFLRWAYSDALATARSDRIRKGRLSRLGLPAWRWRRAVEGIATYALGSVTGKPPARRFEGLLNVVNLAGGLAGIATWKKAR